MTDFDWGEFKLPPVATVGLVDLDLLQLRLPTIGWSEPEPGGVVNSISYREPEATDTVAFRKLLNLFGDVFEEPDTYHSRQPDDQYLRDFLEKQHTITLVAEAGQEVIGGLVAYVLDKFEQERKEIYIYDLGVAEAFRRRGVATRLIRNLQKKARSLDAWVVFVQADLVDTPTLRLYESLGKGEEVRHFDILV